MAQWTIKTARTAGSEGTRHLDKLLAAGWEPFAVVRDGQGEDHVYLKLYGKVREEKDDRFVA